MYGGLNVRVSSAMCSRSAMSRFLSSSFIAITARLLQTGWDQANTVETTRDPPVVHQRPPWKEPVAVLPAIGGVAVAVAIVATGRRRTE
jgi:hypothetical protein